MLIVLTIIVIFFLLVYYFIPLGGVNLKGTFSGNNLTAESDSNFSGSQFYSNMRYLYPDISYKISDACSLQKKNEMQEAFDIISNLTVLSFYPVVYGEEISVTCSEETMYEGNMFIGGEGGVTNVTVVNGFHIIYNGKVLLLRNSNCPRPNIATHELLHALGFDHSQNPNNIMYPTTSCDQTIGSDIPQTIDKLYSTPNEPDLAFENATVVLNGKYLDVNFSVRNNGLKYSNNATIIVYADGKDIKEINFGPLDIGYGRKISLMNIWTRQTSVDQVEIKIQTDFTELNKSNNDVIFNLKK